MKKINKRKILITQDYNPLKGTGISVATLGIAKELAKLGYDVTFSTYDIPDEQGKTEIGNVKIVKLITIKDLVEEIQKADLVIPAVSFSYVFKSFGLAVSKICEINNRPYIPWVHTTLQNSKFSEIYGVNNYVQKTSLFIMGEMFKSDMCKKIVCVSQAVKLSVESFGIPSNKVVVILNGLDLDVLNESITSKLRKTNDVICIQRLSPEKGNQLTIAILANLKRTVPDFRSIIVGDGEEVGLIKSLIKLFGLENNVTIMPKVVNGDLVKLIQSSKVFLSSSLTESFGLAVAESMFVGTPVIVPAVEGPKELTENGSCGFTFDPGDTTTPAQIISDILLGRKDTEALAEKAQQKIINDCDVKLQAEKFVDLIEEIMV